MEFQEFCRQFERMCNMRSDKDCDGCLFLELHRVCSIYCLEHPKEAEQKVEQWAKEHPIMTNGDKFKEVFGKPIGSYGAPCPNGLTIYENGTMSDIEWLEQEYKEPTLD